MTRIFLAAAMALTLLSLSYGSSPAAQNVAAGEEAYAVTIRHADLHPTSPRAVRAMLNRLAEAAMTACGASSFSLREVKASVRASTCWRDGMADVLARIGDPLLTAAYDDQEHRHHRFAKGDRR